MAVDGQTRVVDVSEPAAGAVQDPADIAAGAAALVPVLSDGVVTLRALRESDLGTGAPGEHSVLAQARDPEMIRWTTVPTPYTDRDARFFLGLHGQGWLSGGNRGWAVADAATDDFLGSLDLRPRSDDAADVGFGLGSWATGRGVMTRAVLLALGWALDPAGLGVRTVGWQANVGNWRSRRVAWRCGFRGFETVRDLCEQRGRSVDGWIATVRAAEVGVPAGRWLVVPTLPVTARDGSAWELRAWRTDDAEVEAVRQACSDPLTQHWLTHLAAPYTAESARDFLTTATERAATGEAVSWALAPVGDLPVGPVGGGPRGAEGGADGGSRSGPGMASISLFGLTRPYGTPELGWWAHPSVRGRGVVSGAVRAAVGWATAPAPVGLDRHRLLVSAAAGNTSSIAVARAAGFTEFGRGHAEDVQPDGTYADGVYLEYLRPSLRATGS